MSGLLKKLSVLQLFKVNRDKIENPIIRKRLFATMNVKDDKFSLVNIKEELKLFTGGDIELMKNEETGIAKICFSNPKKKNAFTGEMMVKLADVVSDLENWKNGKGVLFYSTGSDFCSGADLTLMSKASSHETGKKMSIFMHDTLTRLSHLPFISAVLAQGKVIGGGTELLTSCDFRLVTTDFTCSLVHLKMGLIPGWGGMTRLVRLLGSSTALKLQGSCASLNASSAINIGLATAVIDKEGNLLDNACNWLLEHVKGDTVVIQSLKKAVVCASTLTLVESLEKERDIFCSLWGGPANKAALEKHIKHK